MNSENKQMKPFEISGKTPAELADFIVSHYHENLRRLVPELIRLAQKVEHVHQDHASCPKGLAEMLNHMWIELQFHMEKEEKILFPMIRSGNFSQAYVPVQMLTIEHQQHSLAVDRLQDFRKAHPLPADACRTWNALFQGLVAFENDLKEHIYLEDHVLHKQVLDAN